MFCNTKQATERTSLLKKNQDIRQTSFPRDTEIEWEYALAVTHYYWLTGVIEFCLEKKTFYLFHSGENVDTKKASIQLVAFIYFFYNAWLSLEFDQYVCRCCMYFFSQSVM